MPVGQKYFISKKKICTFINYYVTKTNENIIKFNKYYWIIGFSTQSAGKWIRGPPFGDPWPIIDIMFSLINRFEVKTYY